MSKKMENTMTGMTMLRTFMTLLIAFFVPYVSAVDIQLSGTPELVSGNKNAEAMFRFPTSTVVGGEAIDLLIEVTGTNNGYNAVTGSHVVWVRNTNRIQLWVENDTDCNPVSSSGRPYLALKASIVKKGTFEPVIADRLILTGFDIDAEYQDWWGYSSRDYMLVSEPDLIYKDASSKVTLSTKQTSGPDGVLYTQLVTPPPANCSDTAADPACNISFVKNNTSEIYFKVYIDSSHERMIGITFAADVLEQYRFGRDYGDAPLSYGIASQSVSPALYLGDKIPDSEANATATLEADGDDRRNTAATQYDDDDGVFLDGRDLQGQRIWPGRSLTLTVDKEGNGSLFGWIDWNGNGLFDSDEQIADGITSQTNEINVSVTVPEDAVIGRTYARFRFTDMQDVLPDGDGNAGEVEDYWLKMVPYCMDPLIARGKVGKNQLMWRRNGGVNGYELYRSETEVEGFERIADGNETLWLDRNVTAGKLYYYKVKALRSDGTTCFSDPVAAFSPMQRTRMTVVPDVVDTAYGEVTDTLHASALVTGNIETIEDAITPSNHVISQTPGTNSFVKTAHRIDLTISDDAEQNNVTNHAPVILSTPVTELTRSSGKYTYAYTIVAQDEDGDNLTFKLSEPQAQMSLANPTKSGGKWSAKLSWSPPENAQQGFQTIAVDVTDVKGLTTRHEWQVRVDYIVNYDNNNSAPIIHSTPLTSVNEGSTYRYEINASDPDGNSVSYKIGTGPSGVSLSGNVLTWKGSVNYADSISIFNFEVLAVDCKGGASRQQWTVDVAGTNLPPIINSTPPTGARVGRQYKYTVYAVDSDGTRQKPILLEGPSGLSVYPYTDGNHNFWLNWTPTAGQVGAHRVIIRVKDNQGAYVDQNWTVNVRPNLPPIINSTPPTGARVGTQYKYTVYAVDSDGTRQKPILLEGPSGLSVYPYTDGNHNFWLNWTPTAGQVGAHRVIIRVKDNQGAYVDQNWTVNVRPNLPPIINSTPPTRAHAGTQYTYSINAEDSDGRRQKPILLEAPSGLSVYPYTDGNNNFWLNWTPTANQAGSHRVAIRVKDNEGAYVDQNWTVNVTPNLPPVMTSTPPTTVKVKTKYYYWVGFKDADSSSVGRKLIKKPQGMSLNGYSLTWTPTNEQVGAHDVSLRIEDNQGAHVDWNWTIVVLPNLPPVMTSTPPTEAQAGRKYYHWVGFKDADDNSVGPKLIRKPQGMYLSGYSLIWTPTTDQIGLHEVVLRVTDGRGAYVDQIWSINVNGEMANRPPRVTSYPQRFAAIDSKYTYDLDAIDSDGDQLIYALQSAPEGMGIDSENGLVSWTPSIEQTGYYDINITVIDLNGGFAEQHFRVIVVADPSGNHPPRITTTPVTMVQTDSEYNYDADIIDSENDPVEFTLENAPSGMEVNATGHIRWVPTSSDNGWHDITVIATDVKGASASQQYRMAVVPDISVNRPPRITTEPRIEAEIAKQYIYEVNATDTDGDALIYHLVVAPEGMQINAQNGNITWMPVKEQAGYADVNVSVIDIYGASGMQNFRIAVVSDTSANHPPIIVTFPGMGAQVGLQFSYDVNATDSDGDTLLYEILEAPEGMQIDPLTGRIDWIPLEAQAGYVAMTVRVTDNKGAKSEQYWQIAVVEDLTANHPPKITSDPIDTARVGYEYTYEVTASDADNDGLTYSLLIAPDGMFIDPHTGVISWTPIAVQEGIQKVKLQVIDAIGESVQQNYLITTAPEINHPPIVSSYPGAYAFTETPYRYEIIASDPDGDMVDYFFLEAPEGMSVDTATHTVSWTPKASDYGVNHVQLVIHDPYGAAILQSWNIVVSAEGNTVPSIISTPVTEAYAGNDYRYMVKAVDTDGDALSYFLSQQPAGMSIDPQSGVISWSPDLIDIGVHDVLLRVMDIKGAYSEQRFSLTVFEAPDALSVELLVSDTLVDPGDTVELYVNTLSPYPDVLTRLYVNGEPLTLSGNRASFTPESYGVYTFKAVASVPEAEATDSVYLSVRTPEDTTPPEAALLSPSDDAEIGFVTEIVGTASDANLAYYRLYLSSVDGGDETLLAEGTQSVQAGVLATLDPTLMENGIYRLRLEAADSNGYLSEAEATYIVTGRAKIGNFSFMVTDFNLNVAGLPVQVNRTYSTLQKRKPLDFGHGWSIDYRDAKLQENVTPGEEWKTTPDSFNIGFCFKFDKQHIVSIALPDGTTESFEFKFERECGNYMLGSFYDAPKLYALNGSEAKLETLDASDLVSMNSYGEMLDGDSLLPYNPQRYRLTLPSGMVYEITQGEGLKLAEDIPGDTLTYSDDGILSSRGESLTFTRDAEGRITKITDLSGRAMEYVYDDNGDLDYVVDQMGYVTEYTYDGEHTLTEYIDPTGAKVATNYYDESGRLIRTVDALGNEVVFEHDLDGKSEVITDKLGRISLYVYDDEGNVISQTNPEGETTTRTYDERGNELTVTNDLGETTTNTYDTKGNLLTTTDALGNVETTTYNALGAPTSISDKNGNTMSIVYNAYNSPRSMTTASGATNTFYYDSFGNKVQSIDENNNTTTYEYDSNWIPFLGKTASKGNLLKETRPNGTVIAHTYDNAGNRLGTTTTYKDENNNTVTTNTSSTYDAFNRLVSETDERNNTTTYAYDGRGNKISETDAQNRTTTYEYAPDNKLIKTTYPDGTTEEKTYDAMGNLTSETDREGHTTRYEYDGADRLIKTTHADGTYTTTEHDAAGRTVSTTDENGHTTTYAYDAIGNQISVTDALGNETTYTYDAQGNRLSETNALGETTGYEYNELNQQTTITNPDGTTTTTIYDISGKPSAKTDPNGYTTTFAYDDLSGMMALSSVTTEDGSLTHYTYDANGRKLTQTDALGRTTRWAYAPTGEMISHTLPMGQSETFTYDRYGKQTTRTDYGNKQTTFVYDSNDRLVAANYSDGTGVTYTYTPGGMLKSVTNGSGTITYTYDDRGRKARVDNPDGSYIAYGYDNVGNIVSIETADRTVTKTYTARNRLKTVTDQTGTTTYNYDVLGRQTEVIYPYGARANYSYDALNRVTKIENVSADAQIISSFTYTLDNNGNRIKIVEHSGRTVDYTYDDLNRLTGETITNDPNGNDTQTTFSYDDVGNMLTNTIDGTVTTYVYNDNDQLTQQNSDTFAYDDNGNLITKTTATGITTYTYDANDKLTDVITPSMTASYRYDGEGNRIGKTVNGTSTSYLIDANTQYAQVIKESTPTNTIRYTYGNDLLSQNGDSGQYFYHYDGLGSTRSLTDSNTDTTDIYVYTPYGELIEHAGSTDNSFLYAGEQFDQETGNYYLRARYYDPGMSRFTQYDSYQGKLIDPKSLNHYLYTGSNPIIYVDLNGHFYSIGLFNYMSSLGVVAEFSTRTAGQLNLYLPVAISAYYARVGIKLRNETIYNLYYLMLAGSSPELIREAERKYRFSVSIIQLSGLYASSMNDAFGTIDSLTGFSYALINFERAQSFATAYHSISNMLQRDMRQFLFFYHDVQMLRGSSPGIADTIRDMSSITLDAIKQLQ